MNIEKLFDEYDDADLDDDVLTAKWPFSGHGDDELEDDDVLPDVS
jgi:hypothetical protein